MDLGWKFIDTAVDLITSIDLSISGICCVTVFVWSQRSSAQSINRDVPHFPTGIYEQIVANFMTFLSVFYKLLKKQSINLWLERRLRRVFFVFVFVLSLSSERNMARNKMFSEKIFADAKTEKSTQNNWDRLTMRGFSSGWLRIPPQTRSTYAASCILIWRETLYAAQCQCDDALRYRG